MHYGEKALVCARGCFVRLSCLWQVLARQGLAILLLALSVLASAPSLAQVRYNYDELGRLIQVVSPDGSTAQYIYDAAGNVAGIKRLASTALSIAEFTPNAGPVGTSVKIFGSGFSTTVANNVVKFNGVTATVTSATANQLVVAVPTGATTGLISVTVAAATAVTTQAFTLSAAVAAPTISSFTPTNGAAGTVVTISGSNFDADKSNNQVTLNGEALAVSASSATQLTVSIPAEATSGKFKVTNLYGTATSANDFYVATPEFPALDITKRGRLTDGGASVTVTGLAAGKTAQYLFDATAGQNFGLGFTAVGYVPSDGSGSVMLKLRRPDGRDLYLNSNCANTALTSSDLGCSLTNLPQTGTYQVFLTADFSHSANFTMTLSADLTGTLTANAATPLTFNTTRAGQNGRYTFNGTAGKSYSILPSDITINGTWTTVTVYAPDGTQLQYGYMGVGYDTTPIDIPNVPVTGTYVVVVDPYLASTGQLKLLLSDELTGTLAVGGATVNVNLAPGRNASYTFSGTAGQNLGLGVSALTVTPSGGTVSIRVTSPTGEALNSCSFPYGTGSDVSCNLSNLPATGTYRVSVDPGQNSSAALGLTLSADLTGALTINSATPTAFTTARPGQNGRYTFAATAGKRYSVLVADTTIVGTWTTVSVLGPDGKDLTIPSSTYVAADFPASTFDTGVVPTTGTYTVFVDPAMANTGQVKVAVRTDAVGTVTVDGASTALSLVAGQNARYTFSGTVGQTLGLGISALSTTPSGGYVRISLFLPTGELMFSCAGGYGYLSDSSCDLPKLPSTGTYTLLIDPEGVYPANLNLTLSNDAPGVLTMNAASATRFTTSRAGQNGRYTFSGTAGKNYSLAVSGTTFPGDYSTVYVMGPDGAPITQTYTSPTYPPNSLDLNNVPATGTYTVFFDPYGASTGSVDLKISDNGTTTPPNLTPNGSLSVGGASLSIAVPADQTYTYTFSGSAGQRLAVGISALSTSPPDNYVYVSVYRPDNISALITCPTMVSSSCYVPPLPSSGTYTVRVQTYGVAASLSLTLSNDQTATLATTATTATAFNTTRPGQRGYFAFSGTAGQFLSLEVGASTFPNQYNITVYKPDGVAITGNGYGADGGVLDLPVLPATGTYAISIEPYNAGIGQTTLRLRAAVLGTLAVDGATTAVSLATGQNGRYTFTGTAGQSYGMAITGVTLTPVDGSYAYVYVYDALGNNLTNCGALASGIDFACNIEKLPATGTYTVVVDPAQNFGASGTLTFSTDVTGPLPINSASATTFTSTRAGRNGRYTFTGTAGKPMSLAWNNTNIDGYWSDLRVYRPDGSYLSSGYFATEAGRGVLDLGVLAASGTYTVVVDPVAAKTGFVDLLLTQAVTGSTAVDAAPIAINLLMGQTLEYTFAAVAGQNAGVQLTDFTLSPAQPTDNPIALDLISPSGVLIKTCYLGAPGYTSCKFPKFTATGTHKFRIRPGANTSSFKMQLRSTI